MLCKGDQHFTQSPMLALSLSIAVGMGFVQSFKQLPSLTLILVMVLIGLVAFHRQFWGLMGMIIGIIWAVVFAQFQLAQQLSDAKAGIDLQVSGYIASLPQKNNRRTRFDFIIDPPQKDLPRKLRLNWYTPSHTLKAGQYWHFTVKLKPPHGTLNPFGFDYERFLLSENIGATGYIRKPAPVLIPEKNKYTISFIRQYIANILPLVSRHAQNLASIKALSIGDRHEISPRQWAILRHTGTLHLFAISGLHIGLVAGMVFLLSRTVWGWTGCLILSPQILAALFSILAAISYAALAGFSISTQRALLMLIMTMMLLIYQRHLLQTTVLAWAFVGVLFLNPIRLLSSGFCLSFFAVFILFYCHSKRLSHSHWLMNSLKSHFALTLALSPLLLFFFQQTSVISPVANLIAIPWVSFIIVPLVLSGMMVMFIFPWLAGKILMLADINLHYLWEFLNTLSQLPVTTLTHASPSIGTLFLALIGVLLLLAPKGIPTRSLGFVLLLPLCFTRGNTLKQEEFTLNLMDVGQGLATVVQTQHHLLVFDTGAKYSADFNMGKAVILPYLRGIGVTKIDRLIISHGDNDHIGGMKTLIKEMPIDAIYSSIDKPFVRPCLAGIQWVWDGVTFKFLSPPLSKFNSKNNNSCVLKIEAKTGSVLLTGDIETLAEKSLVHRVAYALKSDVLIAPHHGSKTSSTAVFLDKVSPKWILIPVGLNNRFRFPHQAVLQRYQQQDYQWFSTAKHGMLTISMTKESQQLNRYRDEYGKYWNAH